MIDNRKWLPKPEIFTYLELTDSVEIPTTNPGFSSTPNARKLAPGDCENEWQPEMAT